ncbi:MAG: 30S ribosomal protein S16 [Planctomycetota bacterium]|nr:30S ribosomal protein S16 [Planctomycetota bacterium]
MAVCIRLKRLGRRNRIYWRICATDKRMARDGRVLEELGAYDPHAKNEEKVTLSRERVSHWLRAGAQPSATVGQLLAHVGIDPKGNEVAPKPWHKKRQAPPPAAKKVAEAKAEAPAEPAKAEEEKPAE